MGRINVTIQIFAGTLVPNLCANAMPRDDDKERRVLAKALRPERLQAMQVTMAKLSCVA